MPKYRIAETLRVEYIVDSESPDKGVKKYMDDFIVMFNSEQKFQCVSGTDFTVNKVNEDGTLGEEVDPMDETGQTGDWAV